MPKVTLTGIVNNPHVAPNAHRAVIKGQEMVATVDTLECEIKLDDLSHGGMKLRFIGEDAKAAGEWLKNDSKVKITVEKA